jgi:predicted nucleotidyltransferase
VKPAAQAQYDFAEHLSTHLQSDARVRAVWLEGSLGKGTATAYSDIDLSVLVNDEQMFRQDLPSIISSISPVLFYLPLDFGAMSAMVLFENMQKLEVWLEGTPPTITAGQSRVLYDPEKVLQSVLAQTAKSDDLKLALEQCLGNFWFGVSHLLGIKSGEFIAATRGLGNQVDYFVTVKILEQHKFRDTGGGHYNKYLEPEVQHELEAILALPEITARTLLAASMRLADLMRGHGRKAASKLGASYPEKLEQAVLDKIHQEFGAAF